MKRLSNVLLHEMGDNSDMYTFLMHNDTIPRKGSTSAQYLHSAHFCGLFVHAGRRGTTFDERGEG